MGDPASNDPPPRMGNRALTGGGDGVRARLRAVFDRVRAAQAEASRAIAERHPDPATLAEALVVDAFRLVDGVAAASPARAEVECARGCSSCCHQQVRVGAPEAIALAQALAEAFPPEWLERLRAILAQRVARIAGFAGVRDHLAAGLPCAFLAPDGACAVYDWRPLVCRGFHSLSRQACERFAGDPAQPPPPIDRLGHYGANGVARGLADACAAGGRDDGAYELHGAVLRALETPDCATRWAAGEDVFAGCKRS